MSEFYFEKSDKAGAITDRYTQRWSHPCA